MIRVYTIGSFDLNLYVRAYWANGVEYSFDAGHLAHATLWQNRVAVQEAMDKLKLRGIVPNGCKVLAFDCHEVPFP